MFESQLQDTLQRIFGFKKSRYDDPGESLEQECLFINIESAKVDARDSREHARVQGECFVHANFDKLPYGYFAKRIRAADVSDTRKFFFFEIDENTPIKNNIVRRSFRFIFTYDNQFDPRQGSITSITFPEGEDS